MKILIKVLFIIIFILPFFIYGQNVENVKHIKERTSFKLYWFVMVETGPSWSHTDLAKNKFLPDLNNNGYNIQFGGGLQFSPVFSIYDKYGYGSITDGNYNVISPTEGLNACWGRDMGSEITYFENNTNLNINLSNLFSGYRDRTVNIGIHLGLGFTWWKSTTFDLNTGVEIANSGNIRIRNFSIPVGINIDFRINHLVNFYVDQSYVWNNNDLVDGVKSDTMKLKDLWSHLNIGIRFKF